MAKKKSKTNTKYFSDIPKGPSDKLINLCKALTELRRQHNSLKEIQKQTRKEIYHIAMEINQTQLYIEEQVERL